MDLRESAYCFAVSGPDVNLFGPFVLYCIINPIMSCHVMSVLLMKTRPVIPRAPLLCSSTTPPRYDSARITTRTAVNVINTLTETRPC